MLKHEILSSLEDQSPGERRYLRWMLQWVNQVGRGFWEFRVWNFKTIELKPFWGFGPCLLHYYSKARQKH